MTDVAELERRAFGRGSSPEERAAARAELAARRAPAVEVAEPAPEPPVRPRARLPWALLASGLALAAAIGVVGGSLPRPSLDVFALPQSGADRAAPDALYAPAPGVTGSTRPDAGTVRLLAEQDGVRVFAYRTFDDLVCAWAGDGDRAVTGCADPDVASTAGLVLAGDSLSVFWGPTGAPRIYELPLGLVYDAGLEPEPSAPRSPG